MRTAQLHRLIGSGARAEYSDGMLQLDAAYVAVMRARRETDSPTRAFQR